MFGYQPTLRQIPEDWDLPFLGKVFTPVELQVLNE